MFDRPKPSKGMLHLLPIFFFLPLLIYSVNLCLAQEEGSGKYRIRNGREKYYNENYDGAISELWLAFIDPALEPKDSTEAYFYLAFSFLMLGNKENGRCYFEKILTRNPDEKLPEGTEEFEEEYEEVRRKIKKEKLVSLTINTNPTGASIYFEGVYKGETPKTFADLLKGKSYQITLRKSEYETEMLSLLITRDTSLTITLRPERFRVKYIRTQPDIRAYLTGVSTGAVLGLTAGLCAGYFGNQAKKINHDYNREEDSAKAESLATQMRHYDFLRQLFYYSSYPLAALGFYIGIRISQIFFWEYAQLNDEKHGVKVCCSIDQNFNPTLSINIRRDLW